MMKDHGLPAEFRGGARPCPPGSPLGDHGSWAGSRLALGLHCTHIGPASTRGLGGWLVTLWLLSLPRGLPPLPAGLVETGQEDPGRAWLMRALVESRGGMCSPWERPEPSLAQVVPGPPHLCRPCAFHSSSPRPPASVAEPHSQLPSPPPRSLGLHAHTPAAR